MMRICPVCSSDKSTLIFHDVNRREWYTELEWDFVSCNDCGMKYLTHILSFSEMWEKYEDIYVHPDILNISEKIHKNVPQISKKILDIGCNHGVQLIPYVNLGWNVYGIDLNKHAIEDCKKYLPEANFLVSTIEDVWFPDNMFDKIQTFHVLEHVYDPKSFLEKCYKILNENWEIEIRIPHGDSLEMKVWGKYSSQSWVPFHINMFDKKTIVEVLTQAWFHEIMVHTNPIPWWWILSFRQWKNTINISRWVTNFKQGYFHILIQVMLYPFLWILSKVWYGEELHVIAKK